ncbi:MAG: DNA-directed RNA polymerase subunit P [Thermoplasmata archaeon]|nr:DNA-directed RNA polymerase subunit P [Thermoplasmata archaeon]
MYVCSRCGEVLNMDLVPLGLQCPKCENRIFYKQRPNMKKVVIAR